MSSNDTSKQPDGSNSIQPRVETSLVTSIQTDISRRDITDILVARAELRLREAKTAKEAEQKKIRTQSSKAWAAYNDTLTKALSSAFDAPIAALASALLPFDMFLFGDPDNPNKSISFSPDAHARDNNDVRRSHLTATCTVQHKHGYSSTSYTLTHKLPITDDILASYDNYKELAAELDQISEQLQDINLKLASTATLERQLQAKLSEQALRSTAEGSAILDQLSLDEAQVDHLLGLS